MLSPGMKMNLVMGTVLIVLLKLDFSFAGHRIVGEPPSFLPNGEPQDKVVSSQVFNSAGGVMANLVLPCRVNGTAPQNISWYRGSTRLDAQFVTSDGTLAINVTEGVDATRTGVLYHCEITNIIGMNNFSATLRSRDVNVSYTFFDGFVNMTVRTVNVMVVLDGAVSLECDFLLGNPPPRIEWRDDNGVVAEVTNLNEILYLENGRYLFIRNLDTAQISRTYRCMAIELLLDNTVMTGPTSYTLSNNLPIDQLTVYREMGTVIGILGMKVNLYYVAASHDGTMMNNDPTTTLGSCGAAQVINDLVVQIDMVPEPIGGDRYINISCGVFGTGIPQSASPTGTVIISDPARVSTPPEGDPELLSRELLVGDGSRTYTCGVAGIPAPSVTWYFNGAPASGVDGLTVNQNVLDIAAPQISHSGIYQCFVKNAYGQVINDDQRTWILEFREASLPMVLPLTDNNTLAVEDRLEGTLIVVNVPTLNFEITVVVDSDPCPTVQWRFEGNAIDNGDVYIFTNPCSVPGALSPHTFTITIANLTTNTSGRYSSVFTNLAGPVNLPGLLVSLPVDVQVVNLTLDFESNLTPACFLSGSNLTMTCVTYGFPRPELRFLKDSQPVNPGATGFERFAKIGFDQIHITEVAMEDEGLYSCEVVGTEIRLPTARFFQHCFVPVIVSTSTSPPNPVVGNTLRLECIVEGTPTPTVAWTKNNKPLTSNSSAGISISISSEGMALVTINSATLDDNGVYRCIVTNDAASVNQSFNVEVQNRKLADFFTSTIIIALVCGIVGGILLITVMVVLLICVYYCAKKSKTGSADFHPYNVDLPDKNDYTDGRGNVDADSDDVQPEAFSPEYESLPAHRPSQPPPYKAAPGYEHGAPLAGDDLEMIKYPPQDSESFVGGGIPYRPDNGYRPSADDFLSEDAQFV